MTYLAKPKFHHPALPKNNLGFTHRDYEGSISTLCAGCGHDSISAAVIQACFELNIEPVTDSNDSRAGNSTGSWTIAPGVTLTPSKNIGGREGSEGVAVSK